ncbi:phage tail protein [Citrobacter sp. RHBSTW-00053]|uniref:phage tail protein n=1 Tax=Citrobacter sp. RHBSTW-00053 TaxID=2742632 RepID=UPI0015EAF180|nr:phage tail protein [Citrobacter sp. RHBSTW-00053]QMA17342.1 tail fiber protein [Citrobacter sp. RHBSTW-00053]
MIYNTGTISINGNTATGTGTNWTAPASQVRAGQTIIVMSNPVQMFQITAINSGTSLTVTPAASPELSGQKYGILVTDSLSVDGLAQSMSQIINEYGENIVAWATFASISANQSITVTINGTSVTIPAIGGLARKGANSDITELKGLTTPLSLKQGGLGANNAADALANLGLGEGSALPVGVPVPWPLATPPTGWMKCNGAPFSAEEYPELAKAYPTNKLPDLRGEFIRGWDDGRGVDSGRGLLTVENDEIRSHRHLKLNVDTSGVAYGMAAGNFSGQQTGGFYANTTIGYDSGTPGIGTGATGGLETRPRNIAFNYIVRAA